MKNPTDQLISETRERAATGLAKYGHDMSRDDLTPAEWFRHHREELVDAAQYSIRCERAMELLERARGMIGEARWRDIDLAKLTDWLADYDGQFGGVQTSIFDTSGVLKDGSIYPQFAPEVPKNGEGMDMDLSEASEVMARVSKLRPSMEDVAELLRRPITSLEKIEALRSSCCEAPLRAVNGMYICSDCHRDVNVTAEKKGLRSACCGASMCVAGDSEGTRWSECEECGKACDPKP